MAFTSVTLLKRVKRENPPLQKELQELQYSHFEKRKLHFCFALKKQVICTKNQRANSQPWKIPKHQHQLSFWNLPTCKYIACGILPDRLHARQLLPAGLGMQMICMSGLNRPCLLSWAWWSPRYMQNGLCTAKNWLLHCPKICHKMFCISLNALIIYKEHYCSVKNC